MAEQMFAPLSSVEVEATGNVGTDAPTKTPIVPVPEDAPAMQFRHPKHCAPSKSWPYYDAENRLVGFMCRWDFENADGKPDKIVWPITFCSLGNGQKDWRSAGFPAPRPPYNLPEILGKPLATVLVVEGEKAADAAAAMIPDMVVTTSAHGADSPAKTDWSPLEGRSVVICPDNDQRGNQYAKAVVRLLRKAGAASVRVVQVPAGFPPKWDLADPMPDGWTTQRWQELMDAAPIAEDDADSNDTKIPPAAPIDDLEENVDAVTVSTRSNKPRLLIEPSDPDLTMVSLRDILSATDVLYDRGVPVRLANDQTQGGAIAQEITPDALVMIVHEVCRPYVLKKMQNGTVVEVNARFSRADAIIYLGWRGEWRLRLLNGIASAPLLMEDGTICSAEGYDPTTSMWCERVPDLTGLVPERPTQADAAAALRMIRETFKTFCFADAETIYDAASGLDLVDTSRPPGKDESAFLVALLTAVCRPSLHLSPGVVLKAASISGAGTGKGLLVRCICIIAFGREPHAVTSGGNSEELEKRIVAELIQGGPTLFLDNLNNKAFRSDLLASAITERPARVRVLGKSQMLPLNASALVILTGNGVSVSEDLARRFIEVNLDARTEDPESREFNADIRLEVTVRRAEMLAALLTIWRWGRLAKGLQSGRTLGSFEQWCRWVRDPLIALGCKDPADRVSEAKERDGRRQVIAELFVIWWERHRDQPVAIRDLDDEVKHVLDPQDRGRQYLSSRIEKLTGTRMNGFVLTRQPPAGKWGAATYALVKTGGPEKHRGHRGHGGQSAEEPPQNRSDAPYGPDAPYADGTGDTNSNDAGAGCDPKPPMPPMPSATQKESMSAETDRSRWKERV